MIQPSSRLRLGIDAAYDPGWSAGLLYVRNLIYALASLPEEARPVVTLLPVTEETARRVADLGELDFVGLAATGEGAALERRLLIRRAKRRWIQPALRVRMDPAFHHLDVTFPGFGRPIPRVPQVHWIPDLQHVHLPHLFSDDELRARDRRIRAYTGRPGVVVVSSESSKRDLLEFVPHPRARVRVWRFCTSFTESEWGGRDPQAAFDIPPHYLYVANQFWVHKEHLTLFEALVILRERGLTPTVVCTGSLEDDRHPDYAERVRGFLKEHGLTEQVRLLGMIDRRDQLQVLRCAAGVIQPSRFEGWSTVVEDVKAVGRPLLLSNIAVHLEQAPDAHFFEVGSALSLAESLAGLLPELPSGPEPEAEVLAAQLAQSRRQEAARSFMEIMREAVSL